MNTKARCNVPRTILPVAIFLATWAAQLPAAPVGLFSYDQLSSNVMVFSVFNLTGAFSLPPDFPVESDLPFTSVTLDVTYASGTQETRMLSSSLDPGIYSPADFEFGAFTQIISATLSGIFGASTIRVGGSVQPLLETDFLVTLNAAPGSTLQAGDFANIIASTQAIPEPATASLLICAAIILLTWSVFVRGHKNCG